MRTIELRSDTFTMPTPAMRRAMADAEVGDDQYGEDPTVNRLEKRAAEIVGATPDFLRRLDEAKLFAPSRSAGGHRRYSRYQLRLAARAREMVDQGTALEAACRIIILEDQLEEALRHNEQHRQIPRHP